MSDDRNQAICLTAPGPAAIGVVRLIGPATAEFLKRHFDRPVRIGACVHGLLSDGRQVLDDPIIVQLHQRSAVDINIHAGAWVTRSVLDLVQRGGFEIVRCATPPLPEIATDGPGMLGREVEQYLPLARTELALRMLLAQEQAWTALTRRAAGAVGEDERRSLALQLQAIIADRCLQRLLSLPRVAIVGNANVGKSTLANALFARERSITADLPGTTRDWIGEVANIDGLAVMLMDTPGQRATTDSIEQMAIRNSDAQIQTAELVVLVLDATLPLVGAQTGLLARYPQALRVINKMDLGRAWLVESVEAVHTIATAGAGLDDLRRAIQRRLGCDDLAINHPRCWTPRQVQIVSAAVSDPRHLDRL